ncbi:glycosyltransferase family 4 protein [uncultured Lutibacter sp.]|uniref:glycosyltransferase family 4 protein n=1 Tax=uncultured Lutibacter sp. TaxID=437739 RepID=UPI002618D306|nr:glycosyltransferase family 4 protein [uncultured Lutibacter sp.]
MKKVLIITYYWPPAGGSGVQRWLKFVKYFRDFNIEPIVYTIANPNYPIIDDTLINEIPKDIEILRKPIWEPNNFLSYFGKKKTESSGFLNPNPSFIGKIIQYIRANFFVPDARVFWVNPSVKYLKKYLSKNKVEVIITTGPPHSLHLIGLKLKQQLKVKWIADFRDPWTEIDYFHQLPFSNRILKKHHKLEEEVLKTADNVMVVGNTMKDNYRKFIKNISVITNGFDDEFTNKNNEVQLDSKFSITHVGLLNADRNSKTLWKVLSEICRENVQFKKDLEVKLIGKVDISVTQKILEFGLTKKVNIINYITHNEVVQFQKKAQVLLLLVNNVPSAKGILTGKIFEYLNAKRPVLAVAPLDGDLAEILKSTQAGFVVDFEDEIGLKNQLLKLYKEFKKGSLKIHSKNIEQFHRRELTKKVSELIEQITE